MDFTLYPFQQECINRQLDFLKTNYSVYNACEQGLGKSVQTCVITDILKPNRTLIICPAVMRLTWEAEINKFCQRKNEVQVIVNGRSTLNQTSDIVIISYNLCQVLVDELKWVKWDLLILDESHMLKSEKAIRTKVVLGDIWPVCKHKIALSGTPITNNVVDGYTLFSKMSPLDFGTFSEFAHEYSYRRMTPWGPKYIGIRNSEKLKILIRKKFFIRYTKEEVLPDLPEKILQKIILPESLALKIPKTDKEKLEQSIKSLKYALDNGLIKGQEPMLLQTEKRKQGEKKVPHVVEFVTNLLDEGQSVVLFAWHTDTINAYIKALRAYNPLVITGSTSAKDRFKAEQDFQSSQSNLFIGQMKAAGVGITLIQKENPISANVVLAEMDWDPSMIAQAIDRCHRIGTKSVVNVFYFIVKNSIDQDLIDTIMQKVRSFNKVIEN